MKKDDIRVVAYKVLKYVHECNKKGVDPDSDEIAKLTGANERYIEIVVDELKDKGYLKGYRIGSLCITLDGSIYLDDNSAMEKIIPLVDKGLDIIS